MRLRITTPRLVPALLLILLGRLVSLTPHAYGSIEVLDDEGNRVRLAQPAERIISLAPSLTEMLFAAGAGDRIVGVVEFSDFPREFVLKKHIRKKYRCK